MGWKAWDAYDREAHERWKALLWRDRYDWRAIAGLALVALLAVAAWYALR